MIDQNKLSLFKELFSQAESVLVVYSSDALRDHLFAATALYKTIQEQTNKEVTLLSSESLSNIEKDIVYLDETKTEIGHRNLCITLDYLEGAVDKVTSAIDEDSNKLHLTIKPKKGSAPLSKENVTFSYTGAEADMVILVGVDDLESLDQIYFGYESLYQNTALVSINSYETSFGNLKLDILGSSSVSEYVTNLLLGLNYSFNHEVATNLLAGIDEETDKLESYLATADTFEAVSKLLRAGARRFARKQESESSSNQQIETTIKPQKYDEDEVFMVEQDVKPTEIPIAKDTSSSKVNKSEKKKKRRGRPRGSKNKLKKQSSIAENNNSPKLKSQKKKKSSPKPGDLDYSPSGFGPVGG